MNYEVFLTLTCASGAEEEIFFLELLQRSLSELLDELLECVLLDENCEQFRDTVHKLKGLSLWAGLEGLTFLCEEPDEHANTKRNYVHKLLLEIEKVNVQVLLEIEKFNT